MLLHLLACLAARPSKLRDEPSLCLTVSNPLLAIRFVLRERRARSVPICRALIQARLTERRILPMSLSRLNHGGSDTAVFLHEKRGISDRIPPEKLSVRVKAEIRIAERHIAAGRNILRRLGHGGYWESKSKTGEQRAHTSSFKQGFAANLPRPRSTIKSVLPIVYTP